MKRRVALHTLGCKLNYSETSSIASDFVARGYDVVELGEPADVIVINTCTVTEQADIECKKIIRKGLRGSPEAAVIVTGCYAQLQPEEIASFEGVHAVVGTAEKTTIAERAEEFIALETPLIVVSDLADTPFTGSSTSEGDARTRAFLKLQDGCDYSCSFCTIPLARGPARAMEYEQILPSIQSLIDKGFQEIVLSGINLGEYRDSKGRRFLDIVQLLNEKAPDARIRISSIEPNTLSKEIIHVVASSTIFANHFHVPLQSGSADVLRRMRRRYNPERYREVVHQIASVMPRAGIGIDVIVGFPGETEEHFEESYHFIESLPFSYLHVFTYSERENTPAASYSDKVPVSVRRARTARLRALSESRRTQHASTFVGEIVTIIPETYDALNGTWEGWSNEYVRVHMKAPELLVQGKQQVYIERQEHGELYGVMVTS